MGISISKIVNRETYDRPIHVDKDNPLVKRIEKVRAEMTGMDRVKMIFEVDDMGDITPELTRCRDAVLLSFLVGSLIGAFGRSRIAYMDFMRTNYQEAFETPLKAKAALQQKVTMGMMSGGFRVGWRCAAFTGIYMLGSTCITSYRNKMGILDQTAGGALAGFLYKFKDGPKAMVSGTVVGTGLGLVAGTLTYSFIKLTGYRMDETSLWYYENVERRKARRYKIMQETRKMFETDHDLMTFQQSLMEDPSNELNKIPDTDQTEAKSSPQTDANSNQTVDTKITESNKDVKMKSVSSELKPTVIQQPVANPSPA